MQFRPGELLPTSEGLAERSKLSPRKAARLNPWLSAIAKLHEAVTYLAKSVAEKIKELLLAILSTYPKLSALT